jgi:putative peptidoglycan lipid II flippase
MTGSERHRGEEDERRAHERLYGNDRRPRLDPGPVDVMATEEPGIEALTVAGESSRARAGRIARSTALFSVATSLSRVAGLVREVVAAYYFGVSGAMSAFTIAFQVPNLVRSLFADAAIQAAFVPVFTEHLEHGRKREAFRLASTLIYLVTLVLTAITALFVLIAPVLMPLFVGSNVPQGLTVTLSQILFPILVMLGTTGMVVGVLNSYNRFGAFAISPFFWNVAIIAVLVGLRPLFHGDDKIYAYAIGVLVGTAIQLAIPAWDLRNTPFRLLRVFDWRSLEVRRVLLLMLPVTLSLGLINFNLLINSIVGSLVSSHAPAEIDKAFRIYMLPQGIFSVAVTTVLFPTLARLAARREYGELRATMANGMRQIVLLLVPAAAAILVLSVPMIRLVYQHGHFDAGDTEVVATALFWFAFSLPFNGLFLLLTRTFFSLQRPWVPTAISGVNLAITAIAAFVLYSPYGVAGIVASTVIATAVSVLAQTIVLRRQLGRLELGRLTWTTLRVALASAALAGASYAVWYALDQALGRGLGGQIVSLSAGLAVGAAIYALAITVFRIPEAQQIWRLVRRRDSGSTAEGK